MLTVTARRDIVSSKGFHVAAAGDRGTPVSGARPCRPEHWHRVLVVWCGRSRGYWCSPEDLSGFDSRPYLALPPVREQEHLPAASALKYIFHFGSNLRRLREARSLTQTELAAAMTKTGFGTAQSTVCYRERREDAPGSLFVSAAARALSVPPFVFYINWGRCEDFTLAKSFLCRMSSAVCKEGLDG